MSPYTQLSLLIIAISAALGLVAIVVLRRQQRPIPFQSLMVCTLVMLVLTVIFDNLMIAVDLYRYPVENFSGLRLGLMPLEDLSYPLAVCLVLPLWLTVLTSEETRTVPIEGSR